MVFDFEQSKVHILLKIRHSMMIYLPHNRCGLIKYTDKNVPKKRKTIFVFRTILNFKKQKKERNFKNCT